ncbi:uncharacterized protein LOC124195344 [Daphnia pulex]|uniref:uncharacterized protein LOC124195344 n=1 Tax=Daphnia pulex TaxID=6669 RepID=UPI001EDFABD7|nr:uncharacterized protein LOC124195344 [Daphnia pulex]
MASPQWAGKTSRVIRARKIGLKLDPLSLILLYQDGEVKVRKRFMPIRNLKSPADPWARAEELKLRHMTYLAAVPTVVLTKLISIAQQVMIGLDVDEAVRQVTQRFSVDVERDLNVVSEPELKRQKELMELTFINNVIGPSDPRFVYDKQVAFHRPDRVSDWDEDNSE